MINKLKQKRRIKRLYKTGAIASVIVGFLCTAVAIIFATYQDEQRLAFNEGIDAYNSATRLEDPSQSDSQFAVAAEKFAVAIRHWETVDRRPWYAQITPGPDRLTAARSYLLLGDIAAKHITAGKKQGDTNEQMVSATLQFYWKCLETAPGNAYLYAKDVREAEALQLVARTCQLNLDIIRSKLTAGEQTGEAKNGNSDGEPDIKQNNGNNSGSGSGSGGTASELP